MAVVEKKQIVLKQLSQAPVRTDAADFFWCFFRLLEYPLQHALEETEQFADLDQST